MRKMLLVSTLLLLAVQLFAQLPNTISKADKIYGLSKFWQEVNYNFVYLDRIDRNAWDSTYKAMITQVENTTNDYDYYRLLQKFCATLHDGHTNVWMPGSLANLQLTKMFGNYWFGTKNIDGKAIITNVLKSELKQIPIGSEITEVNGMTTAQYLADSVKPYISSSTEYVRDDNAIATMLMGLPGQSYKLKIKRPDGSILPLEVTHARTTDTAFYPALVNNSNLLDFKWYKNDIAYVALNSFGDEKIDSIFETKLPELYKAKAVIIDLRRNGGGSTGVGTGILQYFLQDSIMPHSRYHTRENRAAFKAWGKYVKDKDTTNEWDKRSWMYYHDKVMYDFDYAPDTIHLAAKRITVPVVLLIGHGTASAAEDFLIAADGQKQFTKMGENSFGSTGQPYLFDMPGGGGARVCTKKDTYPDGREFVGYGVKPDIEVKPTVQDFIDGKDPVMDAAVKYLEKKVK